MPTVYTAVWRTGWRCIYGRSVVGVGYSPDRSVTLPPPRSAHRHAPPLDFRSLKLKLEQLMTSSSATAVVVGDQKLAPKDSKCKSTPDLSCGKEETFPRRRRLFGRTTYACRHFVNKCVYYFDGTWQQRQSVAIAIQFIRTSECQSKVWLGIEISYIRTFRMWYVGLCGPFHIGN